MDYLLIETRAYEQIVERLHSLTGQVARLSGYIHDRQAGQ